MDPRTPEGGVQLFGLRLSVQLFYSAVGLLLAAIAFTMLGPLLTLKSADLKECTHSWIFALPRRKSFFGFLLEILIMAVTILWASSPVIVFVLQGRGETQALSSPVLFVGKLGLFVAFIIQSIAVWQLRRVRLGRSI